MEFVLRSLESFGSSLRKSVIGMGRYTLLLREVFYWMVRPPYRVRLVFRQLHFVGNKSFNIILLSSVFTGAVLGLQLGKIFGLFQAEGIMGAATGKSLALELAPVMCGFIVTGRAGAAMAAEIATMRVNEQIDAMEAMGVDPISYLIVPRVLAATLMMPVLSGIFLTLGVLGCYVVGQTLFKVDSQVFLSQLQQLVWVSDIRKGLFKATVFGFILSSVACYRGYYARGGAKGVGEATTQAVVTSLLAILIIDFFITYFQMK
ncbi:MAG: ABC transporter permease [Silvanigrellales bacterium]|jgi:phospholipid/cholesterol/gamma-HCH transport system permease protein|nr:ABC transporter permease [Silvanigrellales bacterium]